MEITRERSRKFSSLFLILLFIAGLVAGGILPCYLTFQELNGLQEDVANLENRFSKIQGFQNISYHNITIYQNTTALSNLYERVRDSVVLVEGMTGEGTVQGSGFVYNFSGEMYVLTNYHVVRNPDSLSVTFSNGNGYKAEVTGTDPYADLAVLSVDAPRYEFQPVKVVSSSVLEVGDSVIAIGNPYGLRGSMTTGLISALGRTITGEEYMGGFSIANIIQTSAPINPGNSGGPLLDYQGNVVGVTTAIARDSQGLGFAVPSNTILREIASLIETGSYDGHSYLGVTGRPMNYWRAQEMDVNVTYGWEVVSFLDPSPAKNSSLQVNDIIIAMKTEEVDYKRIKNVDDLASFLERYTLPQETVILQVIRKEDQTIDKLEISVTLGTRPPPQV